MNEGEWIGINEDRKWMVFFHLFLAARKGKRVKNIHMLVYFLSLKSKEISGFITCNSNNPTQPNFIFIGVKELDAL